MMGGAGLAGLEMRVIALQAQVKAAEQALRHISNRSEVFTGKFAYEAKGVADRALKAMAEAKGVE